MVIGTKRTMDGDPALDVRKALIQLSALRIARGALEAELARR